MISVTCDNCGGKFKVLYHDNTSLVLAMKNKNLLKLHFCSHVCQTQYGMKNKIIY